MSDILKEVDSALQNVKTHVARFDGCGHDQVGAECESVTALNGYARRQPDEGLLQRNLNADERQALASRGQLLFNGAQVAPRTPAGSEHTGHHFEDASGHSHAAVPGRKIHPFGIRPTGAPPRASSGPCRTRNGKYPHPQNPQRYYSCNGGMFVIKSCDTDYVFDEKHQYCVQRPQRRPSQEAPANSTTPAARGLTGFSFTAPSSAGPDGSQLGASQPQGNAGRFGGHALAPTRSSHSGSKASSAKKLVRHLLNSKRKHKRKKQHDTSAAKSRRKKFKWLLIQILKRAVLDQLGSWRCSDTPTGRMWEMGHSTVEQCWSEALQRKVHYLLLGANGCQFWNSVTNLTSRKCGAKAYHVISVKFYRNDLQHLNREMQMWVSARPAAGVVWGTVSTVPYKPTSIRGCCTLCHKFGQDFARIDRRGCRCGMATNRSAAIRQEDLDYLSNKRVALDPGFTVQLHAHRLGGWECTAAPSSFVPVSGAQSLQEALEACQRRRFRFLAPAKDNFYCGNNTDHLERFSRTQCQMNITTTRSYSIISINVIQRQIQYVEEYVNNYVFWWVAEKAPVVFWTSLLDVSELEQCVLGCNKRFVAMGQDGCSCGSLRRNHTEIHVQEWMAKQASRTGTPDRGYLLLDKEGSVNVPEGWQCTTEPSQWKRHPHRRFSECIEACHKAKNAFVAFGRSGCRCGDRGGGLRRLPMARCQAQLVSDDAYSVLSVPVWRQNYAKISARAGLKAHWVSHKPHGAAWEAQPGATVLDQCIIACNDRKGVRAIMLGVDGCECGLASSSVYVDSMDWTLASPHARGFFLVESSTASAGYAAQEFEWAIMANDTMVKHNISVSVQPTWIRLNGTSEEVLRRRLLRRGSRVTVSDERVKRTRGPDGHNVTVFRENGYDDRSNAQLIESRRVNSTRNGATKNEEIIGTNATLDSKVINERQREKVNNTERHFISAQANAIIVASQTDKRVDMESETVDKVAKKGYRRHFVKGIRRAHNTEQFIHNKNEHLVRGTTAFSDIVQKDVAVNQTHADSSGMAALTKRTNMKQNMVGAKSKGFAFGFQIHIGGACYSGSANKTNGWGTHVNSSDAEVAKTVNRWHKKNGTITTDWKSHLAAGPIKNQFRLRLHVKKLHNFTESLNLTTRQDAVMVHSARGVPFRPPKRPIFH
ncbi:uncharacterized protein LOC119103147 [Pollicipes pollicipes]|uniref:uncharacterized protein LOC119103147 n=1 Tax=Pollicipes pollicipes TaxID=41117 RepID=UPI001885725D|nr:uncharacterized protein LOC119103147 [Pollicipes pollicipes]